jgi:polyisoprenoid-binding protein YceI
VRALSLCLGAAALVFVACGSPGTVATPAPDTPTPTDVVTTPTPIVVAATPTPPAVVPTLTRPAATVAPTTAADPRTIHLTIDQSTSKASYHAHEQLVGKTLPSEAVGTSNGVSGSVVLTSDGAILTDQSKISVDLSKLSSDESRRDNFIKGNTLQTNRFPTAEFVPKQANGLPAPLPGSGSATFELDGDMTVHGVTKPVTWHVDAQFEPTSISGTATTTVNISDFGMTPPKAGPVLAIEDALTLELSFTFERPG